MRVKEFLTIGNIDQFFRFRNGINKGSLSNKANENVNDNVNENEDIEDEVIKNDYDKNKNKSNGYTVL